MTTIEFTQIDNIVRILTPVCTKVFVDIYEGIRI
jgi:hypothetical protein